MSYRTEDEAALLREFLKWLTSGEYEQNEWVALALDVDDPEQLIAEFMKHRVIV